MNGLPVTIRLLDPPLHEFVPQDEAGQAVMARQMNVAPARDPDAGGGTARVQPHARPPRLPAGHHLPEITEMQRAVFEAGLNMQARGVDVRVEIMVPLVARCASSTPRMP